MKSYWRVPFFIFLRLNLCSGQLTSSALCANCSTALACRGCNLNADVVTMYDTTWVYGNPAVGTPLEYPELHFTAYSVTSTSLVYGNCVKHTGSPVPLVSPYVVPAPDLNEVTYSGSTYVTKDASASTAEYSVFLDKAYSALNSQLGYEGCTARLPPSPVIPPYAQDQGSNPSSASATARSAVTPLESLVPTHNNQTRQIIILAVMAPTTGLVILLISFFTIRKYRMKRSLKARTDQSNATPNTQLYVDQKAELEDEERRKHELHGEVIQYEMQGEDRTFEMPGESSTEMRLPSFGDIHDLRGVEHSQELEVPSISL